MKHRWKAICLTSVLIALLSTWTYAGEGGQGGFEHRAAPQVFMPTTGPTSADGRWAAGVLNGGVRIWDCKHKCVRLAVHRAQGAAPPVFRPGDNALMCNNGRYSLLIDPATGRVRTVNLPYGLSAFSSDGKYLALAGGPTPGRGYGPMSIFLLDGKTFTILKKWPTAAVLAGTLTFSQDDTVLKLGGVGGKPTARIYLGYPVETTVELKTGKATTIKIQNRAGHRRPGPPAWPKPPSIAANVLKDILKHNTRFTNSRHGGMWISPKHTRLVTFRTGVLNVWDLNSGQWIRTWQPNYIIQFLGWRNDSEMTFAGCKKLVRWNTHTGAIDTKSKSPPPYTVGICPPQMAPDGEHFLYFSKGRMQVSSWSADNPLWQRKGERPLWGQVAWHRFAGKEGKLCFFIGIGKEVRLVEAESGKVLFATNVVRNDKEKVNAVAIQTQSKTNYLILGIGGYDTPSRSEEYTFLTTGIRHVEQLAVDTHIRPKSVVFTPAGKIYVGGRYARVRCLNATPAIGPINLSDVDLYLEPNHMALDPSAILLCVSNQRGLGVALDATTLAIPTEAACVAYTGSGWRGSNPRPLNGRIAAFGRRDSGRVDLVNVRSGRTILSMQSWGKGAWASFTPEGKWTGSDAGADRMVIYADGHPLSARDALKHRQPKAIRALLAEMAGALPGTTGR